MQGLPKKHALHTRAECAFANQPPCCQKSSKACCGLPGCMQLSSNMAAEQTPSIPVIDISALLDEQASDHDRHAISAQIGDACKGVGFFCISNAESLVPNSLRESLLKQAREVCVRSQSFLHSKLSHNCTVCSSSKSLRTTRWI